jgi:uncharacterized membrane-anchored protein YhcB (DUF1043 family)
MERSAMLKLLVGVAIGYQVRMLQATYRWMQQNPDDPDAIKLKANLEKKKQWLIQKTDQIDNKMKFDEIVKQNKFDEH